MVKIEMLIHSNTRIGTLQLDGKKNKLGIKYESIDIEHKLQKSLELSNMLQISI